MYVVVGYGVWTIHYLCPACYSEWQSATLMPEAPGIPVRHALTDD
jgi:hypothetical protein